MGGLLGRHYNPHWVSDSFRSCVKRYGKYVSFARLGEHGSMGLDFRWCDRAVHHHLWDQSDLSTLVAKGAYILHDSLQELHVSL